MVPRVSRLSRQSGMVVFCLAVPLNWAAIAVLCPSNKTTLGFRGRCRGDLRAGFGNSRDLQILS